MTSRFLIALAGATLLVNCDETCPEGYLHRNHVCIFIAAVGTGGSGSTEDSGMSPDGGDTPQNSCADHTFGNGCMTADDCGCDTAFCAGMPGQKGICSHDGCLEKPEVCPSDWKCGDFSAFKPGLSVCTPPGT